MINVDVSRIAFDKIRQLSPTDTAYATDPESFSEWIAHLPSLPAFGQAIAERLKTQTDRQLLVDALSQQYDAIGCPADHLDALLGPHHFTVTTAHQPTLLTGPLYFIYKICSTIHLARKLATAYPDYSFSPVFVTGGEDHDFEEMNHCHLFGKTFTWQTDQGGAVGRMHIDDLAEILGEISVVLGSSPHADALRQLIDDSFAGAQSYGRAMQEFVIRLFEGSGLVVLNMDDARLKQAFLPVMKAELVESVSHALIAETQTSLEAAGYKPQAYLRDINLFYLTRNDRCRIEIDDGRYRVVGTELEFSEEEMVMELQAHPEKFSPNVNLRPVYQETILPNLAYVGGGGEIAYWLERKTQFAHLGVPFPILIRRNSVLHINKGMHKLRRKLGIDIPALFNHVDENIAAWIQENAEHEIDIQPEADAVGQALDNLREKAHRVDPSLATKVEAYKAKTLKDLDNLGKRLVRAEKGQHENTIQQIRKLHDKLFPGGGLQERHDNFMQFYLAHGPAYLETLIAHLDPLEDGFIVLEEPV